MNIAFFIEGNPNNPGGYNQTLNSVNFLSNSYNQKDNLIFIANNNALNKELKKKGINSTLFEKNFINKFSDYLFGFSFILKNLFNLNFQHSFAKFLKKKKIDLIIFLGPSELALFCGDTNFVLNIWDLDHKKNSPYPEHKTNHVFEKKEEFLKIVLFKAFKIVVAHNQNKEDLIKIYNCMASKILVQTFIPYLPNIPNYELSFFNNDEKKYIENLHENKKIILYPATFWAHKNHKYIIDSLIEIKNRNINNFHFIMCGSDRGTFKYIKKLVVENKLSDHITILPLVSNLLLKNLYEKCFAVIMPTDAGPTNLPLYEAMYFKKPIFYSKNLNDQEVKEIIISIDIKNPSNFVNKIIDLKDDEIAVKINLGSLYYKKYCNQNDFNKLYMNIIKDFKEILSKWRDV